jgi:hypothetical protein
MMVKNLKNIGKPDFGPALALFRCIDKIVLSRAGVSNSLEGPSWLVRSRNLNVPTDVN